MCVYEYVCDIFFSFEHKGQQPELTALHPGKPGSPSLISDPRDNVFPACSSKAYLYFLHPLWSDTLVFLGYLILSFYCRGIKQN